jgi:hypothetical protein
VNSEKLPVKFLYRPFRLANCSIYVKLNAMYFSNNITLALMFILFSCFSIAQENKVNAVYKFKINAQGSISENCKVEGVDKISQIKVYIEKSSQPFAKMDLCTWIGFKRFSMNLNWKVQDLQNIVGQVNLPDIANDTGKVLANNVSVMLDPKAVEKTPGYVAGESLPLAAINLKIAKFNLNLTGQLRRIDKETEQTNIQTNSHTDQQ